MVRLLWHDYRYFPYERTLAEREARQLFGVDPTQAEDGLLVESERVVGRQLTYFKAVQNGRSLLVPDQAKLEASGSGNGSAQAIPTLRRQSTRYSAHGLHEYRGKFNPQLVRAIGNLLGLKPGNWILDPFCGSGTTLLEAAHIGWNAIGVDLNPLGVLIANAKLSAFRAAPATLARQTEALAVRLDPLPDGSDWRVHLPDPDYLEAWFPVPVLRKLRAILVAIEGVKPAALREVFRVALSDICREVSLQDPGDLRIRRRKNPADDYPAVELFTESMRPKVSAVIRARQLVSPRDGTTQVARRGDSRDIARVIRTRRAFDAAITSPPYATAMPYLDTQRLSLALLGLLGARDLRGGQKQQIGNREIADQERLVLEEQLRTNAAKLPDPVITFCRQLLTQADHKSHGVRRRNMPALVYKYLADMAAMFRSVLTLIRPKGCYALVVGRNTTELRGQEILINTPQLLADTAVSRGWAVAETLTFETYPRFELHQGNSIREEVLLILRAP